MRKKNRLLLLCCLLLQATEMFPQIGTLIDPARRHDWSIAGVNWAEVGYTIGDDAATFDSWYNVTSNPFANLDKTGTNPCDAGLQTIINGLTPGHFVLLYFPEGTYRFNNPINITRGNLVLRGANPWYTTFICNGITVQGSAGSPTYFVTGKTTNSISTSVLPSTIIANDYVELSKKQNLDDNCVPASYHSNYDNCRSKDDAPGAEYQYGQISKVLAKSGSTLTLEDKMGIDYLLDIGNQYQLKVTEVLPIKNVGIEDIKIKGNADATVPAYTIYFRYTLNCWITGVESDNAEQEHFGITKSAKTTISGCYIHHSQVPGYSIGYGIYLGDKSTNCLVENNITVHLRHGIVLSTNMPHKNVIAYNYAAYSESGSPENILLHGFFPNATLFEGNVTDFFQSDAYWGYNGNFNTTFRNWFIKLENYYTRYGNIYGNHYDPAEYLSYMTSNMMSGYNNTTSTYPDISYYRTSRPDFLPDHFTWPVIGPPAVTGQPTSNTNPAEERYGSGGQFTINPRDEFTGYSIENFGLISGFNAIGDNPAVIYRNQNDLSIGVNKFYENNSGYWDVGPMTTALLDLLGTEEIITSYNNTDNGTAIYRSTGKTNPPVLLLSQANSKVTAIVAGDFDGNGIDEYFTAISEGNIPKLYKSNTMTNLKQTLFYTGSSGSVISCLAAGDVDGTIVGGDAGEELFIGINFLGNTTRIYRNNNASTFGAGTIIYENTDGYWDIAALACGDFDSDGDDELIEGFNSADGGALYKSENGDATVVNIYSGNPYTTVRALAAGDLDLDGDEELVSGFNSSIQGSSLYKSEDASPGLEVMIYSRPEIYWSVASLAIEKSAIRSAPIHPEQEETSEAKELVAQKFLAFPNPSEGSFYIQVLGGLYPDAAYKVFNLQGQELTAGTISEDLVLVNLDETTNGILLVQVINGPSSEFVKVVVQR